MDSISVVVQSPSHAWLFATPWTEACQAALALPISQSLPKFTSIESVMPSISRSVALFFCLQSFPASESSIAPEPPPQLWPYPSLVLVHVCLVVSNSLQPMDCHWPGSSVHEIFPAGILEWVAISYSSRSSWPRDWTHISPVSHGLAGGFCTTWETLIFILTPTTTTTVAINATTIMTTSTAGITVTISTTTHITSIINVTIRATIMADHHHSKYHHHPHYW